MADVVAGVDGVLSCSEPQPARRAALPGVSADRLEEFQRLYDEHFRRLSSYCASLVGDRAAGAELAQEAFTRLFARWRHVREPRAWLFYVGTTLSIEAWRLRDRERTMMARLAQRELAAGSQGTEPPWLHHVVERLAPRLREVVVLHYYADLPVDEIARLLHRPVGTVKRRLHEARGALAGMLDER